MNTNAGKTVNRRRVLFIGAALAGAALVPPAMAGSALPVARWRGVALGADAQLQLAGVSDTEAAPVFAAVEREIARLEAVFSLYRADSAVSRLNATGVLDNPPPELLELLATARSVWHATGGLFDPTVQPLFRALAEHVAGGATPGLRIEDHLADALALVGFDKVSFDTRAVRLARPGMALTFNGIAQGYLTDRVSQLLRGRGYSNILVDLGEIRALGPGRHGGGWLVGLAGHGATAMPQPIAVTDRAVATSAMHGTTVDAKGTAGHILHPLKGTAPAYREQVTVMDASATRADALSTAAVLMDDAAIETLRRQGCDVIASPFTA